MIKVRKSFEINKISIHYPIIQNNLTFGTIVERKIIDGTIFYDKSSGIHPEAIIVSDSEIIPLSINFQFNTDNFDFSLDKFKNLENSFAQVYGVYPDKSFYQEYKIYLYCNDGKFSLNSFNNGLKMIAKINGFDFQNNQILVETI
jgi:hypothetical protein